MIRSARAGALTGALLALGLLVNAPVAGAQPHSDEPFQFTCTTADSDATTAAAADTADDEPGSHPSGKEGKGDTEPDGSGTQGRSNSDPDGMENGGADKPGCYGGSEGDDIEADRDGNNGCGNDADFEDDNNGNCGKKRHAEDGQVSAFGVPDEPADDPAPADEPAPVVKAPVVDDDPAPVVADDPPADEEVEDPIVWADEDPAADPDPDEEYPGDNTPPTTVTSDPDPADPTGSPDLELAAHHTLPTGGLLALGLLAAGGALFGRGRLIAALARRR